MTNFKQKFIKELEREIESSKRQIVYIEEQIKINLPQVINEHYIKISNLNELLKDIENTDSFSEPIFSYENNEEDYD
jgi:DNA mismatch repair ATPase MutS